MGNELVNRLLDFAFDPDMDVWKFAEEVRAIVRREKEEIHVVNNIYMELAKATLEVK